MVVEDPEPDDKKAQAHPKAPPHHFHPGVRVSLPAPDSRPRPAAVAVAVHPSPPPLPCPDASVPLLNLWRISPRADVPRKRGRQAEDG